MPPGATTAIGDVDVFLVRSEDGGRSWSQPERVNNDARHDGADQFFQWLAVDPSSGAVNVIFYDRRQDPENRKTLVTLARSSDQGQSFINYRWSLSPFIGHGEFIGDYIGATALDGHVWGVWSEQVPGTDKSKSKNEDRAIAADGGGGGQRRLRAVNKDVSRKDV